MPAYLQEIFRDEFVAVFECKVVFLLAGAIESPAKKMLIKKCVRLGQVADEELLLLCRLLRRAESCSLRRYVTFHASSVYLSVGSLAEFFQPCAGNGPLCFCFIEFMDKLVIGWRVSALLLRQELKLRSSALLNGLCFDFADEFIGVRFKQFGEPISVSNDGCGNK
jgi:hypothetical protein